MKIIDQWFLLDDPNEIFDLIYSYHKISYVPRPTKFKFKPHISDNVFFVSHGQKERVLYHLDEKTFEEYSVSNTDSIYFNMEPLESGCNFIMLNPKVLITLKNKYNHVPSWIVL